eukprot:GEZU01010580.1.p1 GENE.GEZU01010580.1~~GEZU01010580.1.p1  ORF type:complete len:139 (-),score=16.15 GEZU01010580.1:74-490(-)
MRVSAAAIRLQLIEDEIKKRNRIESNQIQQHYQQLQSEAIMKKKRDRIPRLWSVSRMRHPANSDHRDAILGLKRAWISLMASDIFFFGVILFWIGAGVSIYHRDSVLSFVANIIWITGASSFIVGSGIMFYQDHFIRG